MSTTMTSKGQVTIPKPIRDYLGLGPGSKVEFEIDQHGEAVFRAVQSARLGTARSRTAGLRGVLKSEGDTDALMELLRDYAADEHDPAFGGSGRQ